MVTKKIKQSVQNFAIGQALKYVEGNPEENLPRLMDLVDKFSPDGWLEKPRALARNAIEGKSNWYEFILKLYELDPGVRKTFFENFIFNSAMKGAVIKQEALENISVTSHGRCCWIRHLHATSNAKAAGLQNTAIS